MKYREFGDLGFEISTFGLGCMRLPVKETRNGKQDKGNIDEEQAIIKVRNDLREEKLELQKVLKEEFSRKDISHDKERNDVDNSQPVFEFEFGVEDTVIEEKPKKDTRKKWWKK